MSDPVTPAEEARWKRIAASIARYSTFHPLDSDDTEALEAMLAALAVPDGEDGT